VSISHTADVVLFAAGMVAHTADVLLQDTVALTHTADVVLAGTLQHTSDLAVETHVTLQFDPLSDPVSNINHDLTFRMKAWDTSGEITTNPSLRWYLHDSGAGVVASGVGESSNSSETEGGAAWAEISYTLSGAEADAITDYTDLQIEFRRIGPASISWVKFQVPFLVSHTVPHYADVLIEGGYPKHTTDVVLLAEVATSHTADVLVVQQNTESHTADVVLVNRKTVFHTADVVLLKAVQHTADVVLVDSIALSHTADLFLVPEGQADHTADVLLIAEIHPGPFTTYNWVALSITPTIEVTNRNTTRNTGRRVTEVRKINRKTIR